MKTKILMQKKLKAMTMIKIVMRRLRSVVSNSLLLKRRKKRKGRRRRRRLRRWRSRSSNDLKIGLVNLYISLLFILLICVIYTFK